MSPHGGGYNSYTLGSDREYERMDVPPSQNNQVCEETDGRFVFNPFLENFQIKKLSYGQQNKHESWPPELV